MFDNQEEDPSKSFVALSFLYIRTDVCQPLSITTGQSIFLFFSTIFLINLVYLWFLFLLDIFACKKEKEIYANILKKKKREEAFFVPKNPINRTRGQYFFPLGASVDSLKAIIT